MTDAEVRARTLMATGTLPSVPPSLERRSPR